MAIVPAGIAVGGYIPGNSPIHRLDPRTKLAGLVLMTVGVSVASSAQAITATVVTIIIAGALCRAGWRIWWWALSRFVWMLAIVALVHLWFPPSGKPIIAGAHELPITVEGATASVLFTLRLAEIIVLSMILTFTTTPRDLTRGCVRLARPLERLHVPIDEIGLVVTLAMRFVPLLQLEVRTIVEAQVARGVPFATGGLVARSRNLVSVLVPALTGAIRRADLLATAMAARGFFPGAPRSEFRPLRLTPADAVAGGVVAALFLVQIIVFR